MSNKLVRISGEVVFSNTRKTDKYGKHSITIKPTAAGLKTLKGLKLRAKVRVDEETGEKTVAFSRDPNRIQPWDNKPQGPPVLEMVAGGEVPYNIITNGSKVTCEIQVYEAQYEGSTIAAHSLQKIYIHELIPLPPRKEQEAIGSYEYE